jgi:putative flippase GtrA
MNRFPRFVLIGAIGFVADAGMLFLLLGTTSLGAVSARVASIAFALMVTWQLNRWLTFGPSSRSLAVEGARYGGVGVATSMVNFLVYSAILWAAPGLTVFLALVIASLAALAFSFLGYSRLVFDR